ncbi:uncharacterized protein K441DRAFT_654085, partial [Cenococcum geophilum 1.58]|uniref:uncharacterized protein n=1 Tax=Cenococcum geophilum 1.58 TaxID=794803 RepID=UPI00358E8D5D
HVTAPRFNLMARILLHDEHEHGSWYLTTVLPTCTHCPTYRQDLAPIRLRNDPDNPSIILPPPKLFASDTQTVLSRPLLASYCYLPEPTSLVPICLRDDPVAGTVLLPYELISSVPIRLRNPNTSLAPYCYPNLIRSRADMPTEPALAPYCHRQEPAYDTNTVPH